MEFAQKPDEKKRRKMGVFPILHIAIGTGHRSSDVIAECPPRFSVDCMVIRYDLVTDRETPDPS